VVEVDPGEALAHTKPIDFFPGFNLEGYPNRDSLSYAAAYGIPNAKTFFRGTLRYQGTADIFYALNKLGYLNDEQNPVLQPNHTPITWKEVTQTLLQTSGPDLGNTVLRRLGLTEPGTERTASRINHAFQWLGLYSNTPVAMVGTILDALCNLLAQRLKFQAGEHDMILLRHNFGIKRADGKYENRSSTLVVYGDQEFSAMAKTVGYPTAAAAKLILEGHIIRKGVLTPLTPDIVYPMLSELQRLGIYCKEQVVD